MACIIKDKKGKTTYYYIVDVVREGKKIKHLNKTYIGSNNTLYETYNKAIINKNKTDNGIMYSTIKDCGDVETIHNLIEKLKLNEIIDKHTAKRNQGTKASTLAEIAITNRISNPLSKTQIENWLEASTLPSVLKIDSKNITSQAYTNGMKYLTQEAIEKIEDEFVSTIIKEYDIDTSHLIYDATNFFTFLAKETESELAKTGHDKANRFGNRTVGLSMIVTPDCNVPLMHDVYPGNVHDSVEFKKVLNDLKKRYEKLFGNKTDITITFDRGNNSDDTIEKIAEITKNMHYVGGLRLSQISKVSKKADINLLEVPLSEYVQHNKKKELKLYRCSKYLYGKEHTVLLMHNEKSYKKQLHTLEENINKCLEELQKLKDEIQAPVFSIRQNRRTKASTTTLIRNIFANKDYMSKIIEFDIIEKDGRIADIKYKINEDEKIRIKETYLGKRALYTNRDEWTNEEIEAAYSAAWHVEHGFRQMKDDDCINVSPMFHWTDSRIRAHIFYCVMAYRICCIMRKQLLKSNVDISINEMVSKLRQYKKVITVSGLEIIESYTKVDDEAREILEILS